MRTIRILDREIPYELKRTKTRGIRMMYRPENDPALIVHAGRFISERRIRIFLTENSSWIAAHLAHQKSPSFELLGKPFRTKILSGTKNRWSVEGNLAVFYMKNPEDDAALEKLVKDLWKTVLSEYAEKNRGKYERVTGHTGTEYRYGYMHTRYGSCNPRENRIHLNIQLAQYAPEIIDAIAYHEYAHFAVTNHSARFYKVLEGYCPSYRKTAAGMRTLGFSNPVQCVKASLVREDSEE